MGADPPHPCLPEGCSGNIGCPGADHSFTLVAPLRLKVDDMQGNASARRAWATAFTEANKPTASLRFHQPTLVGQHVFWADMFFAFDSKRIFGRARRFASYKLPPNSSTTDIVYSTDGESRSCCGTVATISLNRIR